MDMAGPDDTVLRLARIWGELLPVPATATTDFFAAGGHSLLATRMLSRVEREFGIRIALGPFYREPTLGALAQALRTDQPARLFRFDRVMRLGEGTEKPVFAVVHSNGAFIPLGQVVGASHPFVALQAADRRGGGQLPGTIEEVAQGYVRQLRIAEPTGPYVLLGWCLAGNIAYEAAQLLRAAGQEVAAVVMVDTWNPAYLGSMAPGRRRLAERSYGWQIIATEFLLALRREIPFREFLSRRNAVRRLVPGPAEVAAKGAVADAYLADRAFDDDLLDQLWHAARRYHPRPYDGRVLIIASSQEPRGWGLDRRFGWGALVQRDLRVATVRGDHLSIFVEPASRQVVGEIQAFLDPGR